MHAVVTHPFQIILSSYLKACLRITCFSIFYFRIFISLIQMLFISVSEYLVKAEEQSQGQWSPMLAIAAINREPIICQ